MKKIILILCMFSLIYIFNNSNTKTIPNNSIRYRIIPNSNSYEDQKLKWDLNVKLIPILNEIGKATSIEESRKKIKDNLSDISSTISEFTSDYDINYGLNYFPSKTFENTKYAAGNYESLVIKLGKAEGDNWWCVMFPPLCLMEAKYDISNDLIIKSYVYDSIKKNNM